MKIQLTIKTTYLPKWGRWEGIRELIQNGRDAEMEHQAPLAVDWYNDTLRIENTGTVLEQKALLLGHTTKLNRSDLIGQFGEGLKLGVLALVREGIPVKIRTGSEVWIPFIERSEQFDEDVLTFRIESGREFKNRVRVEIGDVSRREWDEMKGKFLFLSKPKDGEQVQTSEGTLLFGDKFKGQVFVKGIFVQHDPSLTYGYDLRNSELDRDRKMVESWNLRYTTKSILTIALSKESRLFKSFADMLDEPTLEVEAIDNYDNSIPQEALDFVAARFIERHGADAIPVLTLADSKDIEHLGKKGVIVRKQLATVLSKKIGDLETVKSNLTKEVVRTYGWTELSEEARAHLTEAIDLVAKVVPLSLDDIEIVDFRSPTLHGQFDNGRVLLALHTLQCAEEAIGTLIHEVAHRKGDDGDHSHVSSIERIWQGVYRNLRKNLSAS